MKKQFLIFFIIFCFIAINLQAEAEQSSESNYYKQSEEDTICGYKKSETISLDEYLYDDKKQKNKLKLNKRGDVIYNNKVIITHNGNTINDTSDSYLLMKIYFVAYGALKKPNCDETDPKNGYLGLGCYVYGPEDD